MMKRLMIFVCLLTAISISAQNDTTISRVVTVERDFQPVIQSAGKIDQRPIILQPDLQLNPVVYSTYSTPLAVGHNIHPLQVAETKFTPQAPLNGVLEGAVGHRNTHLLFGYRLQNKDNVSLNLYANHDGYWLRNEDWFFVRKDAQSTSVIGVDFARHFNQLDLYANVEGDVMHWDYQQGYVKKSSYEGGSCIWDANANIGVKSTGKNAFLYRVQTGYAAVGQLYLAYPTGLVDTILGDSKTTSCVWRSTLEHMMNTHLDASWTNDTHTAGVRAYVKNNFYKEAILDLTDKDHPTFTYHPHSRHAIRLEPFYAYNHKNLHLHAGVNIDMNTDPFMGGETWLSNLPNLGFAPSPNVHLSWHTQDNIFHLYADATGEYGTATWDKKRLYNPYIYHKQETQYTAPYKPIDATIGFKLRPLKTLLIDVYGGYTLHLSDYATYANIYMEHGYFSDSIIRTDIRTDYQICQQSYQQWKVGGSLHYHHRDIAELNVDGCYNFYMQEVVYDRPEWTINARLDIHIDSKWSIYSENHLAGSRWAMTSKGDKQIKPIISLNLGGQYAINRWLSVYAQVNDYLNRKDEIFYGFQSQGIHFLAGVKWKF